LLKTIFVAGFTIKAKQLIPIVLISLLGLLGGCKDDSMENSMKEKTTFDWFAVATAPRDYPMEVISGTFYYRNEDHGLDIPSGGTLTTGWGESFSSYVVGPEFKPLPDRLEVTFYSYAEKQVYRGSFQLPYDKILSMFQRRQVENPERPYRKILLGIAPGGVVSVWLAGRDVHEVFFTHAEKIDLPPEAAFALPFKSQEQADNYIQNVLVDSVTPQQLAYIEQEGPPFGAWDRFRKFYAWAAVFKEGKSPYRDEMPAIFINGEFYKIPSHFTEEYANTPKPLLKETNFRAGGPRGPVYEVYFDPIETVEIFEKLGSHGERVYLEFDPQIPDKRVKIRAYNDKESIDFKKVRVK
jgi:hypothetical protein